MDEALIDLARAEEDFLHARERLKATRERFYREVVDICVSCEKIPRDKKTYDICPTCSVWETKQAVFVDLEKTRSEYITAKNRVKIITDTLLAARR